MTLEDSMRGFRLRVLTDATRSGNVTATCARFGVSRTWFYRLRARLERYGPDGLHPKRRQARRGRPSLVSVVVERQVVAKALAWPTRGPQWVSDQLARDGRGGGAVLGTHVLREGADADPRDRAGLLGLEPDGAGAHGVRRMDHRSLTVRWSCSPSMARAW